MMIAPNKNPISTKKNIFCTKNLPSDTIHPSIHPSKSKASLTSLAPPCLPCALCDVADEVLVVPRGEVPLGVALRHGTFAAEKKETSRRLGRVLEATWLSLFVEAPSHRYSGVGVTGVWCFHWCWLLG